MPNSTGPFGRVAAAMVTPFDEAGELDVEGARRLAVRLVDEGGCDALVLSGTTGESPVTSDGEKSALVRAVAAEVGNRARIVAGVGSSDTRHTVALARDAEACGADGLLVVTPYYSRPTQEAVVHHLRTVADATGLPVMLYDIPGRTGTALATGSLLRLAAHPRIRGVKDCAYDLLKSSRVMAETGLAYYAGCDEFALPLRAIGGAGCVSTVANIAAPLVCGVLDAYGAGDRVLAARRHRALAPLTEAVMTGQPGTVAVKALLNARGLPAGPVRGPLLDADAGLTARLLELLACAEAGAGSPGRAAADAPAAVPGPAVGAGAAASHVAGP
ncbi:4-hydroxy-tetrahydrodipicolinate synthase [Streptomyces sp. AA1529]|uniref:4-hydroxy-tetrahydrodipicolinate synthase n=1 Tax=Streptomyces sp. AA1529 TaxID=1203257 RepID=UPI000998AF94|nr:4-hydroxy-tetrahydrodipicolinate synthase [Streptomyces sp. AA1529]